MTRLRWFITWMTVNSFCSCCLWKFMRFWIFSAAMRNAGVLPFKCRETIAGSLHCVGMDFFRIISYTSDYLVPTACVPEARPVCPWKHNCPNGFSKQHFFPSQGGAKWIRHWKCLNICMTIQTSNYEYYFHMGQFCFYEQSHRCHQRGKRRFPLESQPCGQPVTINLSADRAHCLKFDEFRTRAALLWNINPAERIWDTRAVQWRKRCWLRRIYDYCTHLRARVHPLPIEGVRLLGYNGASWIATATGRVDGNKFIFLPAS